MSKKDPATRDVQILMEYEAGKIAMSQHKDNFKTAYVRARMSSQMIGEAGAMMRKYYYAKSRFVVRCSHCHVAMVIRARDED